MILSKTSNMSSLLKICIVVVLLATVVSTPLKREKRQNFLNQWFQNTKDFVKDIVVSLKSGVKGAYQYVTGTIEDEAEAFVKEEKETKAQGREIVEQGRNMSVLASRIASRLLKEVGGAAVEQVEDVVKTLREVADDTIRVGEAIIENAGDITAALQASLGELDEVVDEILSEVGDAIQEVGDSIEEAGKALILLSEYMSQTPDAITEAMDEVEETNQMVVEAGKKIRDVGRHSLSLGERVLKMGKDIGEVLVNAVKNVAQTTVSVITG